MLPKSSLVDESQLVYSHEGDGLMPLSEADGFRRTNMDDLSKLQSCKTDKLGNYWRSQTVSFKRDKSIKLLSGVEKERYQNMVEKINDYQEWERFQRQRIADVFDRDDLTEEEMGTMYNEIYDEKYSTSWKEAL